MPDAWNDKDERLYQHVKDSEEQRGESGERAEEIAARTVNKHRREEGRTPNTRTQGTGNPNKALAELSRDETLQPRQASGREGPQHHEQG